jgi:hypothetical protein
MTLEDRVAWMKSQGIIPLAWEDGQEDFPYGHDGFRLRIDRLIAAGQGLEALPDTPPVDKPGPRKPPPAIPPEVWAKPRPETDYMAAVRAMCGDGK